MVATLLKIAAGIGVVSALAWGAFAGLMAGGLAVCVLCGGFLVASVLRR